MYSQQLNLRRFIITEITGIFNFEVHRLFVSFNVPMVGCYKRAEITFKSFFAVHNFHVSVGVVGILRCVVTVGTFVLSYHI